MASANCFFCCATNPAAHARNRPGYCCFPHVVCTYLLREFYIEPIYPTSPVATS